MKMYPVKTIVTIALLMLSFDANAKGAALPLIDSVAIDGITWKFAEKVPVGRFVNGDYYAVGNVMVTSISPKPENGRNGSVVNIPMNSGVSGFDDRVVEGRYNESLRVNPPVLLKPGDALLSSISVESMNTAPGWLRPTEKAISPVKTISVLTCLNEAVAEDAFRPSYADRKQKIYYANSLKRELLPSLAKVVNTADIKEFAEHYRRPWLDVCFFHFDAPAEYQVQYGREAGRAAGMAALLLMCEFTAAEKEPLLLHYVQYGIDLWGILEAGYAGWPAHGGHGTGRKLPIVFAGTMLGDDKMASPTTTFPNARFGEDMQTMYGEGWTGAKVVYAGHQGVIDGKAVSTKPGWGSYEYKPPSQWADSNKVGEDYRRCCTSIAWVGEALAARLMKLQKAWNHDAFFDYTDRWMQEDDSVAVATIMKERGWDYSDNSFRQGQCWDRFVENMWSAYRGKTDQIEVRYGGVKRASTVKKKEFPSEFFTLTGRRAILQGSPPSGVVIGKGCEGIKKVVGMSLKQ